MTIDRQYHKIVFICDVDTSSQCERQIETGLSDFQEAYAAAREEGWSSAPKDGGGWIHHCGKCPRP